MTKAGLGMVALLVAASGCGDGSSSFPLPGGTSGSTVPSGGVGGNYQPVTGPNMVDVIVDQGPPGLDLPYTNGLFAAVTLCEPGTSKCQTIDHLLVDTGSVGVRVLESLLTISLPDATDASAQTLASCLPFVDGTAWGPLKRADVEMGGEKAAGLTIHLIGEGRYLMPNDCTGTPVNDFQTLAANGVLGVGLYVHDCGLACVLSAESGRNPGVYYACSGATSGCRVASVPLGTQVANPVVSFPVDNNGVIIRLPGIASTGVPSVAGQMVFGIGTQDNNGLGDAAVVSLDARGFAETAFPVGGTRYGSIIDSGSNGLFFLDAATTKLTQCSGGLRDFYCPASTTNLSATLAGPAGDAVVAFSVANASRLAASAFAFSNLAGPMPGFPRDISLPPFDWGLPFFFGRAVFIAIDEQSTPVGVGPYLAF
jgi:hypothetical protein